MTLLSNYHSGYSSGRNDPHQYEKVFKITGNAVLNFSSLIQLSALQMRELSCWSFPSRLKMLPALHHTLLLVHYVNEKTDTAGEVCLGNALSRTREEFYDTSSLSPHWYWVLNTASKILVLDLQCIHSPECLQQAYLEDSVCRNCCDQSLCVWSKQNAESRNVFPLAPFSAKRQENYKWAVMYSTRKLQFMF